MKRLYYTGRKIFEKGTPCEPLTGVHDFQAFGKYLIENKHPIPFTREEYLELHSLEKTAIKKTVPYFIAGVPASPSEGKSRSRPACTDQAFIACLDIDDHHAANRAKETLDSGLLKIGILAYNTISSRPTMLDRDDPTSGFRLRVIANADPVRGKDEYRALVETLAARLGLGVNEIDSKSYTINQPMFFPVRFKGEDC
jgi:limonene-1,2-epoxide hydrolase